MKQEEFLNLLKIWPDINPEYCQDYTDLRSCIALGAYFNIISSKPIDLSQLRKPSKKEDWFTSLKNLRYLIPFVVEQMKNINYDITYDASKIAKEEGTDELDRFVSSFLLLSLKGPNKKMVIEQMTGKLQRQSQSAIAKMTKSIIASFKQYYTLNSDSPKSPSQSSLSEESNQNSTTKISSNSNEEITKSFNSNSNSASSEKLETDQVEAEQQRLKLKLELLKKENERLKKENLQLKQQSKELQQLSSQSIDINVKSNEIIEAEKKKEQINAQSAILEQEIKTLSSIVAEKQKLQTEIDSLKFKIAEIERAKKTEITVESFEGTDDPEAAKFFKTNKKC